MNGHRWYVKMNRFFIEPNEINNSTTFITGNDAGHIPVSYTHLDVYKRQPLNMLKNEVIRYPLGFLGLTSSADCPALVRLTYNIREPGRKVLLPIAES